MSILIKGKEMPKCCCVCPCFNDEYCYCQAADKDLGSVLIDRRHPDCPLIEVPLHGDLVDRDEFITFIKNRLNSYYQWIIEMIEECPTVIPADKGGET